MDTKALAYGIVGFLLGGLVVSIAATTMPSTSMNNNASTSRSTE